MSTRARLLAVLLIGACGDDDGAAPDAGSADPVRARCDLDRAACEKQIECGYKFVNQLTTVDACYEATRCEEVTAALLAQGGAVDTAAVAACRAALDAADCATAANRRFAELDP